MSDIAGQLLLQLILILLNAFFAATEIAVISLNEKKLKSRADDGDKKAVKMLKMIEEPTRFLSTIQIGITLAGFLGSAFAADNFAERFSGFLIKVFDISEKQIGSVNTVAVIVITLILSFCTLVLGELVPKRIAMKHKEKLADAVCGMISGLATILKPIIWLLTVATNGILRIFGIDPHEKENPVSEEDIVLMLDAGADEGSLNETATNEEVLELIETEGYSRMPVFSETTDNIIGVLHSRDFLLRYNRPDFKLEDVMFQPTFVPETAHLDVLFKDMQKEHNHIVIVINEYGETAGIVTMEDILEEIVGDIWDERDEAIEDFIQLEENKYRVLGSTNIEDFFEHFSLESDEETEATTVNGWVSEIIGSIPEQGVTFDYENLVVTVTKADELMAQEITVEVKEIIEDSDDKEDD